MNEVINDRKIEWYYCPNHVGNGCYEVIDCATDRPKRVGWRELTEYQKVLYRARRREWASDNRFHMAKSALRASMVSDRRKVGDQEQRIDVGEPFYSRPDWRCSSKVRRLQSLPVEKLVRAIEGDGGKKDGT